MKYLSERRPMGVWMMSRVNGDDWTIFETQDRAYGIQAMTMHDWSDSFSYRMVLGLGPKVAPRCSEVPAYVNSVAYQKAKIGAYIATPLEYPDGRLWGVLTGVDPEPTTDDLHDILPEVELIARGLMHLYLADLQIAELEKKLERLESPWLIDSESGALTPEAWLSDCIEDEWLRTSFVEAAGVIVVEVADGTTPSAVVDEMKGILGDVGNVYRQGPNVFMAMLSGPTKFDQQLIYKNLRKRLGQRFPESKSSYAYRGPNSNMRDCFTSAMKHLHGHSHGHHRAA